MSLSCSCDFDISDFSWWWEGCSEWKPINSKKRKRCCSCKKLIEHNEDAIEFYKWRHPKYIIEERIHGEKVSIASSYMCEKCSGLYLALDELGYGCLDISIPMRDYIVEYNEIREEW